MSRSALTAGMLLALVAFAACGESSSSDDDNGAAGAPAGGPDCVTDAECPAELPKCTRAGDCVGEDRCDTDADCRGDYKFCDLLHNCEPCRSDGDCPSEMPYCVPGWEFGVYCAVCLSDDSSTCPAGTWCAPVFVPVTGGGGRCEASNCDAEPEGTSCLACINGSVGPCVVDGGECSAVLTTLHACYTAEIPGWTINDCPTGVVPSIRGCTPEACFDEAEAMDACLLGCDAVTTACGL